MHQVTPFQFNSHEVRILTDDSGELLWVAKDVCDVLGYENAARTTKDHCRESGIRKRYIRSGGQQREVTCIDEGNLYRLIIKSTKPESEPFESWVCDEVLPQIRKSGSYSVQTPQNPILALEEEIKEGASLLSAVIGQKKLPESQKWQLVDRLLKELFGRGTELLLNNGVSKGLSQPVCNGPEMYYVGNDNPLLLLKNAQSGHGYRVELSSICCHWFTTICCQSGDVSCSQHTLYSLFHNWFMDSFQYEPPSFKVFHDAMNLQYREIKLVGEPWFVGVAPAPSTQFEVQS